MDVEVAYEVIKILLLQQCPPLKVKNDDAGHFEVCGSKETQQGHKKVDGYYFASLMPKPKDLRFYFFPIYTHPEGFTLSPELQRLLKGKSCFHVKSLDEKLKVEIKEMIEKGVALYTADQLI